MSYYTNATEVKHISTIRATYPNMSIPYGADLSDIGWYAIEPVAKPTPESGFIAIEGAPEQYAPGKWRQTWDSQAAPVPVPMTVTMRQARLALHAAGLLAGVNAAIASLEEPAKTAAQIEWEYAAVVERNAGLVPAMATALGMTERQIDDLFIAAAVL